MASCPIIQYHTWISDDFCIYAYHSFSLANLPHTGSSTTYQYQDLPGPTTHQVPLPAAAHSEQLDHGVTLNVVSAATPAPNEIQRALVSGTQKDN